MSVKFWAGAWLAMSWAYAPAGAAEVGSTAPTVEPKEWLNSPGSVSWHSLKGRLILVEKWATW